MSLPPSKRIPRKQTLVMLVPRQTDSLRNIDDAIRTTTEQNYKKLQKNANKKQTINQANKMKKKKFKQTNKQAKENEPVRRTRPLPLTSSSMKSRLSRHSSSSVGQRGKASKSTNSRQSTKPTEAASNMEARCRSWEQREWREKGKSRGEQW